MQGYAFSVQRAGFRVIACRVKSSESRVHSGG